MIIWTSSRIDAANYCRMRYQLRYVEGEKSLNLSVYEKGSVLHSLIQHFWSNLGTAEEVKKKKKKYSNPEEFAKYAQGKWMQRITAAEKTGKEIEWQYDDEKWVVKARLKDICIKLHERLLQDGPPIHQELEFDFFLGNRRFQGRIDEIRVRDGKPVIRDYKSGNPKIGRMKVDYDPQMTFYNVGLGSLCYSDKDFASLLRISDEERLKLMGHPDFITDKFGLEFFMIESCQTYETTRTDQHFYELLEMIEGIEKAVQTGDIYPERGRKCDSCDMKIACGNRLVLAGQRLTKDVRGQLYFNFAAPRYMRGDGSLVGYAREVKAEKAEQMKLFTTKRKR